MHIFLFVNILPEKNFKIRKTKEKNTSQTLEGESIGSSNKGFKGVFCYNTHRLYWQNKDIMFMWAVEHGCFESLEGYFNGVSIRLYRGK